MTIVRIKGFAIPSTMRPHDVIREYVALPNDRVLVITVEMTWCGQVSMTRTIYRPVLHRPYDDGADVCECGEAIDYMGDGTPDCANEWAGENDSIYCAINFL